MILDFLAPVGNHLWQSTLFAIAAALLTLALRKNRAQVRYWLWFAASLKFLVPFSLLLSLGGYLAPARAANDQLQPARYYSADIVSQPFTFTPQLLSGSAKAIRLAPSQRLARTLSTWAAALWAVGFLTVLGLWIIRWRRVAVSLRTAAPATDGLELSVLRKLEARAKMQRPVALLISDASLEPGIFGVLRPKLVWPRGISQRLNEAQIEAIVAHELAHVRRRDNLTAALHMFVEAIFWFHPIVWWLQSRLMDERERACDEAVVILGSEPEVYAESILRTCEFCIESPVACVSGITGSELKQRLRRIVSNNPVRTLTRTRKFFLAALTAAAILSPILFGFIDVPRVSAALMQDSGTKPAFSYDVATVKLSREGSTSETMILISQGKLTSQNFPLKDLIMFAYDVKANSQISGVPDWVNSAKYDIDAKADEDTTAALKKLPPDQYPQQVKLMIQALLADRFHLKVSHQTKDMPVYALVIATGGPKLKKSTGQIPPLGSNAPAGDGPRRGIFSNGHGELEGVNTSLDFFSDRLSRMPEVGSRVVIDRTGLTGNYSWTLKWTPETTAPAFRGADDGAPPPPPSDNAGPGLFTALQEQLGLKLEPQKGSVEVLVIDHLERPSAN
jgi:bla regulator protein blaR1